MALKVEHLECNEVCLTTPMTAIQALFKCKELTNGFSHELKQQVKRRIHSIREFHLFVDDQTANLLDGCDGAVDTVVTAFERIQDATISQANHDISRYAPLYVAWFDGRRCSETEH